MPDPLLDRSPGAIPLDRATLIARFDSIRQFRQGGRWAPNKSLLLLYALARLKHDRQAEIRFNTAEAALQPLLRLYGPWRASARVSETSPACSMAGATSGRASPASVTSAPEVLANFERSPELIDVAALHLLERHFAPELHEERRR